MVSEKNKISILEKARKAYLKPIYKDEVEWPNNIMLELTNICNLKCEMCFNRHMKREKGFMQQELFCNIIDQALDMGIENFGLYTVGESFLHPKIFDFIKYAKNKGAKYVYITSNGNALNENKIYKLINSGLDSIKFSIDAACKETYEKIRKNAKWENLIKNIRLLRKIRDNSNLNLKIFGSYVITNENYNELLVYESFFKNLIDETFFCVVYNQGGYMNVDSMIPEEVYKKNEKVFLPEGEWEPCSMLWNRFVVTYDGKLTACCIDFNGELEYGDLTKHTLKECWNNNRIKQMRNIHINGDFKKLPRCLVCSDIKIKHKEVINFSEELLDIVKEITHK